MNNPRLRAALFFLLFTIASLNAHVIARGTNQSEGFFNVPITIAAGTTNASFSVAENNTGFSYLFLKRGSGAATPFDFDFSSTVDGASNSINLETPEISSGAWNLAIYTPSASGDHEFEVEQRSNIAGMRSDSLPASKPSTFTANGTLTPGSWQYFQVSVNIAQGYRLVLSSTGNADPDLYVARDFVPEQFLAGKRSEDDRLDTITFSDGEFGAGTYFIGVFLPGSASGTAAYTLSAETNSLKELAWDPGLAHLGTEIYTNESTLGGDYHFKVITGQSEVWRTVLNVISGEADLYLHPGTIARTNDAAFGSARSGSDGLLLHSSQFEVGEEWFITVRATPGSRFSLMSGAVYVEDLGELPPAATVQNAQYTIGQEGARYFKTTIPQGTEAWRLGLNGRTSNILMKKSAPPHGLARDFEQARQTLVVPPYLNNSDEFFFAVVDAPGTTFTLDSKQQPIQTLDFSGGTTITANSYGYATYRVQVPVEQISWQMSVTPSSGNANIAVRKDFVPNEFFNDAFSEAPGLSSDSIVLVPPGLTDGTFYITVYGVPSWTARLESEEATIDEVTYLFHVTNNVPGRVGWRYYQVTDIDDQLGTLGWLLQLQNQAPGTEIALRANAVPSSWFSRSGYETIPGRTDYYDYLSDFGYLQRPRHQADVWYIGVYSPDEPLGQFRLRGSALVPTALSFDGTGSTQSVNFQPAGAWSFFRVDVPTNAAGWDIRLANVTAGVPKLVVSRDQLPSGPDFTPGFGYYATVWPSGYQMEGYLDWTGYPNDSEGNFERVSMLAVGKDNPLTPGTYYVGVYNSDGPSSYTVVSRGIGRDLAIPITSLPFNGGRITNNLPAREAAYYEVIVPTNVPSWRVKIENIAGENLLLVQKATIPSVGAAYDIYHPATEITGGKKLQTAGAEYYTLLPYGEDTNVAAGTYYLAVVSEGTAPAGESIGSGNSSYILTSEGPLPITQMGNLQNSDLALNGTVDAGELKLYEFQLPQAVGAVEVSLENVVGSASVGASSGLAIPGSDVTLAVDGGTATYGFSQKLTIPNPSAGRYRVTVSGADNAESTTYGLRVRILNIPQLQFNGGQDVVVDQEAGSWRYYLVNVDGLAIGWDIRVQDVLEGQPQLHVRRDAAPPAEIWQNFTPHTNWLSLYEWRGTADWTRLLNPDSSQSFISMLQMGMGNPLERGTYLVGVYANEESSYTIRSRGIGDGNVIPITNVNFTGSVTNTLPAREAAYYRVEVPTSAPGWKIRLQVNSGDALMLIQKDVIPNITASPGWPQNLIGFTGGILLDTPGNEHYLVLPRNGETSLEPGAYYIGVVSQGANPDLPHGIIGEGSATYVLQSLGEAPVIQLGTLGSADITRNGELEESEANIYAFNVPAGTTSMEFSLEEVTGFLQMSVAAGIIPPPPYNTYSFDGGAPNVLAYGTGPLTIANPTNGPYRLIVANGDQQPGSTYRLRIKAIAPEVLDFNTGRLSVIDQPPSTWRYFSVTVPSGALGWDLRVINVTTGYPSLYVRKGDLPDNSGFSRFYPFSQTDWLDGEQLPASGDWTAKPYNPDGVDERNQHFIVGMGLPLEPGDYVVGVRTDQSESASYTIASRGIGAGFAIPVRDLNYSGGSHANTLLPREAAYYRIVVPENAPTLKLSVTNNAGDTMIALRKDFLPNPPGDFSQIFLGGGKNFRTPGNEHFVLLPSNSETSLPAGAYYLAVGAEGVNPTASNIGTDSSTYVITSHGPAPVTNLGVLSSTPRDAAVSLDIGEVKLFTVEVSPGTAAFEIRLLNRAGNSHVTTAAGRNPVTPVHGNFEGGILSLASGSEILNVPNPAPGTYSISVAADTTSPATFTLSVRQQNTPEINFSQLMNTNGRVHFASNSLANGQKAFYKIEVPPTLAGHEILGWSIEITDHTGVSLARFRKDFLPTGSEVPLSHLIVVPPVLTPGSWYVEVEASGDSSYTLTSSEVTLERPAWTMPGTNQTPTTPGVAAPFFGDSGVMTNGIPLPDDRGVDLAEGKFHFYAVMVPTNNGGVMRSELVAISGNPDLFIREGAMPSRSHDIDGDSGELFDRASVGVGTEYGNWVPIQNYENRLRPGLWYLAVQAQDSNVRYRLRLSTGNVTNMTLIGGNLGNQNVAANDWRYIRMQIPENAPIEWNVTFQQVVGDVAMYVRDTVPPGDGAYVGAIRDWRSDQKNYWTWPVYDDPGTHTIPLPPLRPGNTYYLGFYANNDATFTISSSTSGGTLGNLPELNFYNGSINTNLPANSSARYLIRVPADAARLTWTSTHSDEVHLLLEQGTLPNPAEFPHYRSHFSDSSFNMAIRSNSYPWIAGVNYYLVITNMSATAQPLSLALLGFNQLTEDEDIDELPDYWEVAYFGGIFETNGEMDSDGDGNSNRQEFIDGTDPTLSTSGHFRITLTSTNGTAEITPVRAFYSHGETVTIRAVPAAGFEFVEWSGATNSTTNPLSLVIQGSIALEPVFQRAVSKLIQAPRRLNNGAFEFTLGGEAGATYLIQFSTNLQSWVTLTNIVSDGSVTYSDPTTRPRGFYRALPE